MTGTCPHGWTYTHNCPTQPAPDLSDYERGVVERIEAAPAAEESFDAWRMTEWHALPDDMCGIGGCDNGETDPRGPVFMRDGSIHKVCTEHWEPIMRVLGEQATWETTDAMRGTP